MISAPLLQETHFILSNLVTDKIRYEKCLDEITSAYLFEKKELFSSLNAVKYESDRVQNNGKPDDKYVLMELKLERLERKYQEDASAILEELETIMKLTSYINTRIDDKGNILRWLYIGWDSRRDGAEFKDGSKLKLSEIADELSIERHEISRLLRKGEEECTIYLIEQRLLRRNS